MILIAFGAFIMYFSAEIKIIKAASFTISSAFFPRICAVLLIVLGALLIVTGELRAWKAKKAGINLPEENKEHVTVDSLVRMALTLVILILFVALMKPLGFLICSVLMQLALMITLAPAHKRATRDILSYLAISVCVSIVVYLLFVKVFFLILPAGVLKGVI